jgi:hypothetical protein
MALFFPLQKRLGSLKTLPIADSRIKTLKKKTPKNIIAMKNLIYLLLLKNQINYYEQS